MKKLIIFMLLLVFNVRAFGGLAVSGDGRIKVGPDFEEDFLHGLPQYSVDEENPIALAVPLNYTGYSSRISLEGNVIAGQLFNINENEIWMDWRGAIWEQIQVIDDTPFYSDALLLPSLENWMPNCLHDMSMNGKYIVGHCEDNQQYKAVYWDENREVHSLGSMYYDSLLYCYSSAGAVSDDKIILGSAYGEGAASSLGFIWDEQNGMRYVKDVLEQEYGCDFGDSVLEDAGFADPDGTIIKGSGHTSTGDTFFWTATIPEPGTVMLLALGGLFLRKRR